MNNPDQWVSKPEMKSTSDFYSSKTLKSFSLLPKTGKETRKYKKKLLKMTQTDQSIHKIAAIYASM